MPFLLFYVQGMSYAGIAEILEVTWEQVCRRVLEGIDFMGAKLQESEQELRQPRPNRPRSDNQPAPDSGKG